MFESVKLKATEFLITISPSIVKWSSDSRSQWQTCTDTGSPENFCVFLEVCHTGQTLDFVTDTGWWFSYQNYVEIEFEDGTIRVFKTKNGDCLTDDKETFRELVEFIDDYASNGRELTDKTAIVLDEDDPLVV